MPRKSKKKSPKTTTSTNSSGGGGTIASKRHWIYTSSSKSGSGSGEDEYSQYLHQRVQRTLVRSVPSTYSYFGNGDDDDGKGGDVMNFGEFYVVIF